MFAIHSVAASEFLSDLEPLATLVCLVLKTLLQGLFHDHIFIPHFAYVYPIATLFWRFQKRSRFNNIRVLNHIEFYGRVVVLVPLCTFTTFNYKPKLDGNGGKSDRG